jgi:uncharacterized repeat protein (TIGR02543 family)
MLILFSSCKEDYITISYETYGGNRINDVSLYEGEDYVYIHPFKEGYTFIGWYTDPSFDNIYRVTINHEFKEDTTLYAKWEINSYIVEVRYANMIKRYNVKYNEYLSLEALEYNGWLYNKFYYNSKLLESNTIIVKSDMYILAAFEEVNFE